MTYPEDFSLVTFDLEIDFGDKGGIQRFAKISDFDQWLSEETAFWTWAMQPPASNHLGQVSLSQFGHYDGQCRSQLQEKRNRWSQILGSIRQLEARMNRENTSAADQESFRSSLDQHYSEQTQVIDQLKQQLNQVIQTEIIQGRNHITRMEPAAIFIRQLADDSPEEAVYALDQIILEEKKSDARRRFESNGRTLATLFLKDIKRDPTIDAKAFKNVITTWDKELADFKARYEEQTRAFSEVGENHRKADTDWRNRADKFAEEFSLFKQNGEKELQNVKDTYDAFMQIKAPLTYWKEKRSEHSKGKFWMSLASGISAVLGWIVLTWVASKLLPEAHPANQIPWRQIGLFLLASTFVLWIIRLCVKLMLSHIHLEADAREREVMISTFLALIQHQEGLEALKKQDISLVIAPIFRPSTSGVISDDGSPSSLGDFLKTLTSGKG
jgi:hypothetical protein